MKPSSVVQQLSSKQVPNLLFREPDEVAQAGFALWGSSESQSTPSVQKKIQHTFHLITNGQEISLSRGKMRPTTAPVNESFDSPTYGKLQYP
ncbi:hypothetical protein TNIN_384111 [Trichonephila inaurata madagascariensis]|uniref:Uncharacterized protein n=1 Tax=Trichonephila inaurata madagascariensis TaxID=2747483 RepID=A0A8X7BTB1_9ARAC|nr:hypothetical protein TNIN_384111 [Trichonephila inaurata madagascariensis]